MAVALDLVTHGMPSLRLFGNHKAADGSDVYEQFADIFTVLQVPAALCSIAHFRCYSRCTLILAVFRVAVMGRQAQTSQPTRNACARAHCSQPHIKTLPCAAAGAAGRHGDVHG